jgi:hypothetical protein
MAAMSIPLLAALSENDELLYLSMLMIEVLSEPIELLWEA